MAKDLEDPAKPPHYLIEKFPDGSARRNDGRLLKAANSNPYYLLMTANGEIEGGLHDVSNAGLWKKNRRDWNRWASAALNADEREKKKAALNADERAEKKAAFGKKFNLSADEFTPFSDNEKRELEEKITAQIAARTGAKSAEIFTLPDPGEDIDLSNTYFTKSLVARQFLFPSHVKFIDAAFGGEADFSFAAFGGEAEFRSASFGKWANFYSTSFESWSIFNSASFGKWVNFDSASFEEWADFQSASFTSSAAFFDASFSNPANFCSASFGEQIGFNSVSFDGWADFTSASFDDKANFSNCSFAAFADFRGAIFISTAPGFYQCQLHEDTRFTTSEDHWPKITNNNADDAKRAYARLRQAMNKLQIHDDEHFFFRQEMRCKEKLEGRFQSLLLRAYRWSSDYGHSIGRPLAGLFLLILIGAAAHWLLALSFLDVPAQAGNMGFTRNLAGLEQALRFSFANCFSIFGFQNTYFGNAFMDNLHCSMKWLAIGQNVFGFALLFLLGLGLRQRFRIK